MLQQTPPWMLLLQPTMPVASAQPVSDGAPGQVGTRLFASIQGCTRRRYGCGYCWRLHSNFSTKHERWLSRILMTQAGLHLLLKLSAGAGMASSSIVKAKIASLGMSLLQPPAGLAALERLLAAPALTATPMFALTAPGQGAVDVVPFRWCRMLQHYQPLPPLFQAVVEEVTSSSGGGSSGSTSSAHGRPLRQQVMPVAAAAAATPVAAAERLLSAVRAAVQDVLGREVGDVAGCVCACCSLFSHQGRKDMRL